MPIRLEVKTRDQPTHSPVVSGISWTSNGELYSTSDDKTVHRWAGTGDPQGRICQLPSSTTHLELQPAGFQQGPSDLMAVACTDGKIILLNKSGRIEKTIDAHSGAVIALRWSYDGQVRRGG